MSDGGRPRVGVVGVGSMGQNHARVLSKLPSAELAGVFDADGERARTVALRFGTVAASSLDELIGRSDALIVAVPTTLHRSVAEACIAAGKHVLVEKPLAASLLDAESIVGAAERAGVILLVGHIERFSPVVEAVREILAAERPHAFSARRLSQPTPHIEVDVILDLMIHDLDLVMSLTGGRVTRVAAAGRGADPARVDHVVALVELDGGVVCDLTASKLALRKIRELTVAAERAFITVDHVAGDVVVYRETHPEFIPSGGATRFREQTLLERPYVPYGEPLQRELEHFVHSVRTGKEPLVSGRAALEVLRVATKIAELVAPAAAGAR